MSEKINERNYIYTENNSILFDDESSDNLKDISIDMYNKFTIGITKNKINTLLNNYISIGKTYGSDIFHKSLIDLFKFAFMIRDCRGDHGRGFRDIFYNIIDNLYNKFPHIVCDLLSHIPIYGSWKDIFNLMEIYIGKSDKKQLLNKLISIVEKQRAYDLTHNDISLLGKYLPSEKSKHKKVAKILATRFYDKKHGNLTDMWKNYRITNSFLNKKLDTVEIKMCADEYDKINYEKVPGKALKIYTNAFANEKKTSDGISYRYPENKSRIDASFNYKKFLENKTKSKKGTKLYPHGILKPIINNKKISDTELSLIESQFNDWISKMCDIMENNEHFLKMILLCDISGSMYGTPIEVSISLSYLFARAIAIVELSKYGKVTWGDRIMIFSSCPYWFIIDPNKNILENVTNIVTSSWYGTNTDFLAVHELILNVAIQNKIPSDKMPITMLTTSDMQFDSAIALSGNRDRSEYKNIANAFTDDQLDEYIPVKSIYKYVKSFKTHHDILRNAYNYYNYEFPLQIYWNLRGNTNGIISKNNTYGTVVISGFTPSNIKSIFEGVSIHDMKTITPYDLYLTAIDCDRYKIIENTINYSLKSNNNLLILENFASMSKNKTTIKINYDSSMIEIEKQWFYNKKIENICEYFDKLDFDDHAYGKRKLENTNTSTKRHLSTITDMLRKIDI